MGRRNTFMETLNLQLDLEFNWKDDTTADTEIWGLSLPFTYEPE